MEILELIMIVLTGLLLFSTIVCGLYIRYSGKEIKNSDLQFHMGIGSLAVISAIVTIILLSAT